MELEEIQTQCRDDSERWFPGTTDSLAFMALAIAGEAGELCNYMKKIMRGSIVMDNAAAQELALEVTDVFIYVCNFANALGFDLAQAYQVKRKYNEGRFGGSGNHQPDPSVEVQRDEQDTSGSSTFVPIIKLL